VIATLIGQREAVDVMNPPWRRKLWLLASLAIAGITVAVVGSSDFNRPSGDAATGPTYARILKGGYPVCDSEDLYERMREAEAIDNDDARLSWTNSLLNHGCVVFEAGTRIRIGSFTPAGRQLDGSYKGFPVAQIGVYLHSSDCARCPDRLLGEPVDRWTAPENVTDGGEVGP
jgi:hypothetical protein